MKIYISCVLFSIFLQGCFTVPGTDRITTVTSCVNEDLGCIRPRNKLTERVEYIPANQSFKSKVNYLHDCLINYSWGRGWTNKQNFEN